MTERKFEILVPFILNKTGERLYPEHITSKKAYVLESQLSTDEAGLRWHIKHRHMMQVEGASLDLSIVDEQPKKSG